MVCFALMAPPLSSEEPDPAVLAVLDEAPERESLRPLVPGNP
jgi:hypothetical protein